MTGLLLPGSPLPSVVDKIRWFEAVQDGSVEIPPFAVCEVTGAETRSEGNLSIGLVLKVRRPTAANLFGCVINGPSPITTSGSRRGAVTYDSPMLALYDTADTPAYGDSFGTQANLFTLKKGNAGFGIIGGHADGRVLVERTPRVGSFVAQNGGSTISARSGTTAGSGTVTIFRLVGTTLTTTSRTLTVYNMTDNTVAANAYIQCKFDMFGTAWVDVEDC